MPSTLSNWLLLAPVLALRATAHRHGHAHGHHPHAARAAANTCASVIITETVYVTAMCPQGQCVPSTTQSPTSAVSSALSIASPPPVNTPPANTPPVNNPPVNNPPINNPPANNPPVVESPAPLPQSSSSSVVYSLYSPPGPTPATASVTFTSATKPEPTADHSLLCDHVEMQAKQAGVPIPPMPYGANLDASVATYNALPTLAAALCQAPAHFHKVTPSPKHGSIKNSCGYDVYVDSVGCGRSGNHDVIAAGQTWSEELRSCSNGGVVYKVTKADAPSKPIQFEVKIEPENGNLVWYDISFLDCMVPNTTDLSACPGWEGGVQCIPGKKDCQVFVCGPGEYCDGSTYTVPEFGLITNGPYRNEDTRKLAGAPVTTCKTYDEGIAFELCAAN